MTHDFKILHPSLRGSSEIKERKLVRDPLGLRKRLSEAKKDKKKVHIKCQNCDKSFVAHRYWSKFCSPKCRDTWNNKEKKNAKQLSEEKTQESSRNSG